MLCKIFKIYYYLPSRVIFAASACILDWFESDDSVPVQIKDTKGGESAKTTN